MKYFQKIIFFFAALAVVCVMSACGRYSDPSPIDGSGFPHNYPAN